MSDAPSLVSVRVKSRTGDVYVRGGLFFRHDAWSTIAVALNVALKLHDDPWLDVRDLPPDALPKPEPNAATALEGELAEARVRTEELGQQLEAAHAKATTLEERLRVAIDAHTRELEALREAHKKELAALSRRRAEPSRVSSARAVSPPAHEDSTE